MPSLRQIVDGKTLRAYGTSEGVKKAWDTRGRGRNADNRDAARSGQRFARRFRHNPEYFMNGDRRGLLRGIEHAYRRAAGDKLSAKEHGMANAALRRWPNHELAQTMRRSGTSEERDFARSTHSFARNGGRY